MSLRPSSFVHVPAGPFVYGPEACYERLKLCPPLKPQQTLDLPGFWIAKVPVTNREWRGFLESTGYNWEGQWYRVVRGWRGSFRRAFAPTPAYPAGHNNYPVVDVSQSDAYAYCEWQSEQLDRRCMLPTEYPWEKAARGTDGRIYPWGDDPPRPEIQWQRKFPVVSLYQVQSQWGHESPQAFGWHAKTEQLVHRPNVIGESSGHSRCAFPPFLGRTFQTLGGDRRFKPLA